MTLQDFELNNPAHHALAAGLWLRAYGEEFVLPQRAIAFNLRPCPGGQQAGQIAFADDNPCGFVLASVLHGHPDVAAPEMGWADALVTIPEARERGLGGSLLEWAETWLRAQGCTGARLGGGLRPFAPGVPTELAGADFFRAHGYYARGEHALTWDYGHDLANYESPGSLRELDAVCRPAETRDVEALRTFLTREFPGRWVYEFEMQRQDGASISDYMLLESERGLEACCVMTFEDSVRPIERFYPSPLPRPWGQVGSVGVCADRRSAGCGSSMLDAALRHMRERGVRGCIIDWTHLAGYYERFGFTRHRTYQMLVKEWSGVRR